MLRLTSFVVLSALTLPAQRILHTHSAFDRYVQSIRPAGDTNGDGIGDFVVFQTLTSPGTFEVVVVSGATGAILRMLAGGSGNQADAVGIGDVDNDGRSDIVVANATLRCYSGASGNLLYSLPSPGNQGYVAVSELGDFDGSGRPDVAAAAFSNGTVTITIRQGMNGAFLGTMPAVTTSETRFDLRRIGDLNGDGRQDLAFRGANRVHALRTLPAGEVWTITPPVNATANKMETVDLDGDGKYEVLYRLRPLSSNPFDPYRIEVYDGSNGQLRFTSEIAYGSAQDFHGAMCGVGDLDVDGMNDFAVGVLALPFDRVEVRSGSTGRRLWSQPGTSVTQGFGSHLASLGDVDGDGFVDLVAGFGASSQASGWATISGKILAEAQSQGGACGGGPFFPQLGATRPILGQTTTIVGTNGPAGANGLVVLSLQPAVPTYLGVSSCFAWYDLGSGAVIHATAQSQWSLPVPVPLVPQLAGYEVALQSLYAPTNGALGYDLSNGVWARLGYQ